VEAGAAGKMWWLAGFPGLMGETTGESRSSTVSKLSTAAPAGVGSLVGGVDGVVFTYLSCIF
jgi:hypothetical protein